MVSISLASSNCWPLLVSALLLVSTMISVSTGLNSFFFLLCTIRFRPCLILATIPCLVISGDTVCSLKQLLPPVTASRSSCPPWTWSCTSTPTSLRTISSSLGRDFIAGCSSTPKGSLLCPFVTPDSPDLLLSLLSSVALLILLKEPVCSLKQLPPPCVCS